MALFYSSVAAIRAKLAVDIVAIVFELFEDPADLAFPFVQFFS